MTGSPLLKFVPVALCLVAWAGSVPAQGPAAKQSGPMADPVAEAKALAKRIDQILLNRLKGTNVKPAARAVDSVILRRLSLDLTGRIPTLLEVRDYLDDDRPDKYGAWVERQMSSDRYIEHQARVMRSYMLPERTELDNFALRTQFDTFLQEKLRAGVGYDKIAKNLLTGLRAENSRGTPTAFYQVNGNKAEDMASATARVLLGVRLECAQCHAHPFADWTREQFWEMAAFFNRTKVVYDDDGHFVRPEIGIPETKRSVKAKFLDGTDPGAASPYNGPTLLANWIIKKDNPFFARAAVDHVWQAYFGVSLLEPLQEKEATSVSHPELLDVLAREFVEHNFDMKFLIRAIVYSETYQRSSMSTKDDTEGTAYFARMPVRGLSAEQLYDSFQIATMLRVPQVPQQDMRFVNFGGPVDGRAEFLLKFADQGKRTETHTTILQALFLMNSKFLNDKVNPRSNKSLQVLANAPTSHERRIETLYLMVLSRTPRTDELRRLVPYVESGGPTHDRAQALADVYWGLLNSSEFMLNH